MSRKIRFLTSGKIWVCFCMRHITFLQKKRVAGLNITHIQCKPLFTRYVNVTYAKHVRRFYYCCVSCLEAVWGKCMVITASLFNGTLKPLAFTPRRHILFWLSTCSSSILMLKYSLKNLSSKHFVIRIRKNPLYC